LFKSEDLLLNDWVVDTKSSNKSYGRKIYTFAAALAGAEKVTLLYRKTHHVIARAEIGLKAALNQISARSSRHSLNRDRGR
jgi:hypothetical protein